MSAPAISLAADPAAIARCHPVMRLLRPHLTDTADFITQVQRQQSDGYLLAALEVAGEVCAVAGFRVTEKLSAGRFLYVDDLVTREDARSGGHGGQLFDWLVERAHAEGCATLELDSGVQRHGAHRFYLRRRMDISSHHFALKLCCSTGTI